MTAPGKPLDLDGMEGTGGLIERLERHAGKRAPVQGLVGGIPWAMHLRAYDAYCKKWGRQDALIDLEGRGCRGGFGTGELDDFIPGWRAELESPMPPELAQEAAVAVLALLQTQRELVTIAELAEQLGGVVRRSFTEDGKPDAIRLSDGSVITGEAAQAALELCRAVMDLGERARAAIAKALGEQPL